MSYHWLKELVQQHSEELGSTDASLGLLPPESVLTTVLPGALPLWECFSFSLNLPPLGLQ